MINAYHLFYTRTIMFDLHGFIAALTLDELEALKKSSGFISAYTDMTATLETTHTPNFLSLNADNDIWNASNYGKDIIIQSSRDDW